MGKIILTNHAKKRLNDRKITENQIFQTISSPDFKMNNPDGSVEFSKKYGNQKVYAVIKENENNEYIVLSCWVNPPNYGSKDFKNKRFNYSSRNSSGFKKLWYTFLNQIGF